MKTIKKQLARCKERYKVPRSVQDLIPVKKIWPDGIFQIGNRFSMSWKFTDINYMVANLEDKDTMFKKYSAILNGLDCDAVTKITLNNKFMKQADFEDAVFIKLQNDAFDIYRNEYNNNVLACALDANGIVQEKYITITVHRKNVEEARSFFNRTGVELDHRFFE